MFNYVLSLIGEQPLLSSAGNLGQLVRNSLYTSTLAVVQSSRASFFEQFVTGTATNDDYLVPAMVVPTDVIQVLDVLYADPYVNLVPLSRQELVNFNRSYPDYTYDIVGSNLYISPRIPRPANIRLRALVVPSIPTADDTLVSIPKPALPAVAHGAASILCLSYVDDGNAAAQHERLADELTMALRQQYGITRGRTFNIGHNNAPAIY